MSPSVLGVDLARIADDVAKAVSGGADWIHVDVMDGHFVPNLTFGPGLVAALRRITDLPLDVHLMVERPEWYIAPFADAGASVFTFHPETTAHVQRHLEQVRACGMLAGLALNPGTPMGYAEEVVDDLDLLLIMTVNPGFPAQRYIGTVTGKIARARSLLNSRRSSARLQVDGGINRSTIGAARGAGADTFVAGSAIFDSDDPTAEVGVLRRLCETAA
ncbi:MAG: ribulose-phosphate 3-epimerase [Gemmatimonadota bacterium]|nr:MAG: ribulose-phosphate 3-epimerase [Gemmatimonadota bacterium]